MQEPGEGGRSREGTPIDQLTPAERREHLGRIAAKYRESAGAELSNATKAVLSKSPQKIEDVMRGASGIQPAETGESEENAG
ncbi:MAG: hypothetical protein A2785_02140 [Candidatus Chisholmbacteria bacterium RIFCSPHIGHO2_01_FULL_49_18]|uniref:Uncharacterized protein n=2 Tax=Candidatus Chisholmiibacteriota TaxID=1817900 RepID=A0A1G1VNJ2_9BACT|nr:MAG: hypothetical protein A2785_02140 [Candidatus Chisholmbacteria bacterium RIFCSPHIGHO2_01_FULL_49_18]OGY21520.1 MAG: hypothetical protein A3A65_05350 [Candidatus Chisholmbacteria bacterium RIFCSPLOWO2_01_FULL_49_14]